MTFRYLGHVANKKSYISTFTRTMSPRLSQVRTKDEGAQPTKSRETSITSLSDKKKFYIFTLQDEWTLNVAVWWRRMRGTHPQSHVALRSCNLVTNQKFFISFTRRKARMRRTHPTCHVTSRSHHHVTTIQSVEYICSTSSWSSPLNTDRLQIIMTTLKMCSLYKRSFWDNLLLSRWAL